MTSCWSGFFRIGEHDRQEHGQCLLYGEIVAYRLVQAPGVSVGLDIEGRYVETGQEDFAPAAQLLPRTCQTRYPAI